MIFKGNKRLCEAICVANVIQDKSDPFEMESGFRQRDIWMERMH